MLKRVILMCELLGFSAKDCTDIRKPLQDFFSHCEDNPHGWGLMYSGGCVKERLKASKSKKLAEILDNISPQKVVLGHIRYATVGKICTLNCHPFTAQDNSGRQWTLIHNGTVYTAGRLVHTYKDRLGDTDSEAMFLYLIETINTRQKRSLNSKQRFSIVDKFVCEMSYRNKLNLMIYDGEMLYVHKNMEDTMKYRKSKGSYMFATKPLDGQYWYDVPTAQLTAYKDGELVYEGEKHGGIFHSNLQYITVTDAMNI
jgi:glutamine amidotransferase